MRQAISILLKRLCSRLIYDNTSVSFYRIDSEQQAEVTSDLEIEIASLEQLKELCAQWSYFEHRRNLIDSRYAAGDRCILAYDQQQLAHVIWYRLRDEIDASYELGPQGKLPLAEQELILYDAWTPESMRSRGYYAKTMTQILPRCFTISPRVWIYSLSDNQASLRGIEKCGFNLSHRLRRIRWFGLKEILSQSTIE